MARRFQLPSQLASCTFAPTSTANYIFSHAMKVTLVRFFIASVLVVWVGASEQASAQAQVSEPPKLARKSSPAANKPLPSDPEERFKTLFTNATLSGRWARIKDG